MKITRTGYVCRPFRLSLHAMLFAVLPLAACVENTAVQHVDGSGGSHAPAGSGGSQSSSVGGGSGGSVSGLGGAPGVGGANNRDGGRTDTGGNPPPDASSSGDGPVSSAVCPTNALVCDDFEDGVLDGWTTILMGGMISIDTTHARSGRSALSITCPANQAGGFIERKGAPLFPLPAGQIFGRIMVYFDSVPNGHTDIVRGAPVGGNPPWYNVGEQTGNILLNYYNGSGSDCWARPRPGKPVAVQTWTCWEWSFDSTKNQMQFWIDGVLSRQVNATGDGCLTNPTQAWVAPTFGAIRIGEDIAERSATPARMWIDDVAIGTEGRIGCPAPP